MKDLLLYIWQLPQNLLGLICGLIWPAEKSLIYKGTTIRINEKFPGGVSLGRYVFLNNYPHDTETWKSVKHEYGHTRQSKRTGLLYLIVIGVPSALFNLYNRLFHTKEHGWDYQRRYEWYYNLPWEKWADKLGCIERYDCKK